MVAKLLVLLSVCLCALAEPTEDSDCYRLMLPDGSDISCGNPVLESRVNRLQQQLVQADERLLEISSEFNGHFLGVFNRSNDLSHSVNTMSNEVKKIQQALDQIEGLTEEMQSIKQQMAIQTSASLTLSHLNQKVIYIQEQLQKNQNGNGATRNDSETLDNLNQQAELIANLTSENLALTGRLASQEKLMSDATHKLETVREVKETLQGLQDKVERLGKTEDVLQKLVLRGYSQNLQRIQNLTKIVDQLQGMH